MKSQLLPSSHRTTLILLLMLLISVALRLVLVVIGGQYFETDELRAQRAILIIDRAVDGEFQEAGRELFNVANPGYVALAIPPTGISKIFNSDEPELSRVTAAIMSLFSVANIYLVYLLARRVGGGDTEALLAAFFMATSTSMFYYARHLLPYDACLFFILLGLWLSLGENTRLWQFMASGLSFALSLSIYTGYWMTLVIVGLLIVFYQPTRDVVATIRQSLYRVVLLALGLCLPLPMVPVIAVLSGTDIDKFVDRIGDYSGSIDWGEYSEGWTLPWEYLWHTDGFMVFVLLLGCALALYQLWTTREQNHGWYWLLAFVGLYVLLAMVSTVLELFVMYGRLARQLVPFFALASAYGYYSLFDRESSLFRGLQFGFVGIVVVLAAINFLPSYELKFPDSEEPKVAADYEEGITASTVVTVFALPQFGVEPGPPLNSDKLDVSEARYWILNFDNQWFHFTEILPLPEGEIVFQQSHPLRYKPYQYEGYDPEQREMLDSLPIDMMVIDTQGN